MAGSVGETGDRELDCADPGILDCLGMEEVAELPNAVGQARAGARVVTVAVDRDRRAREAEPGRPPCSFPGAKATRCEDKELGLLLEHRFPGGRVRRLARQAEHVLAAC